MKTTASIAGHPLHPMLIVVPAGGFVLALVLDIVHIVTRSELWWQATLPVLLVSLIGALVAAVPGLIDLVTIVPKGRATLTGLSHMVLNLLLVAVAAINTWTRWSYDLSSPLAGTTPGWGWSLLTVGILGASGWLGWMMVQTHHIGVIEADQDAVPTERIALPVGLTEEPSAH